MWTNCPFRFLFTLTSCSTKLNKCVHRLRRVKMEKRILADQGNSLVDFCKVREASERIVFPLHPTEMIKQVASNLPRCGSLVKMQSLMYDVLSEVQSCRGELDSHIHILEKHVEELRDGFRSLMPLLSSTLSTQNSSIRHLLREMEVKTEIASASVDR